MLSALPTTGPLAPPPSLRQFIAAQPWRGGLEPCGDWFGEARVTVGELPASLQGTLYRVGPARIRVGETLYGHWFDGDGQTTAVSFANGRCTLATRLVETPRVIVQRKRGDSSGLAVRGAWTQASSWASNLFSLPSNPANTSPLVWAGKLLALCEGGAPVEIDRATLETKGTLSSWLSSPLALGFGAHFKVDDADETLFNLSVAVPSGIRVFALDKDGVEKRAAMVPSKHSVFVHDFAMSSRYLVLVIPPWISSGWARMSALLGLAPFGHSFTWQPEIGTRVVVLRKSDLAVTRDTVLPPFSLYHVGNAFETEGADGEPPTVHVQVCRLIGDRAGLERNFSNMYQADLERGSFNELHTLSLPAELPAGSKEGDASCAARMEPLLQCDSLLPMEFPVLNHRAAGRRNRFTYTAAKSSDAPGYFDALQKYDLDAGAVQTRRMAPGCFASEVTVVPKGPAEDDCHLLLLVYVAERHATEVHVLDAQDFTGPPLAVCAFDQHVPYTFHGFWEEAATA